MMTVDINKDVNDDAVDIDYVLSEIWSKQGTFKDFWLKLSDKQKELLMNMKITNGAMDWQQRGLGFELVLGEVETDKEKWGWHDGTLTQTVKPNKL